MAITKENIMQANRRMLGKTNRAILFAKVNLDRILDPDPSIPEDEQELTPSLAPLLARINEEPTEQFNETVRDKLTVTSFKEFLEKFQPGFYYRVRPAQSAGSDLQAVSVTDEETFEGGEAEVGAVGEEGAEAVVTASGDGAAPEEEGPAPTPQLEFSLEGGPGWKKVRITMDHPYVKCLTNLIRTRVKKEETSFHVDVDASLFNFKPRPQRLYTRKLAEDVQVKNDRLMLEAKRSETSKDTIRALQSYENAADEFQGALEDYLRVLPTIAYGLEQTYKYLRKQAPGGGPVDTNVYHIEFGRNRRLVATTQTAMLAAVQERKALAAAEKQRAALGAAAAAPGALGAAAKAPGALDAAAKAPGALSASAEGGDTALATAEGDGAEAGLAKAGVAEAELAKAAEKPEEKRLAVRSILDTLDILRAENEKVRDRDLASIPQERRFPLAVGKFMDKMIDQGLISWSVGNLVATVLQDEKGLGISNPNLDVQDVVVYHDMFLGMYTNAVEDFLKTVTPLFETVMGIYLLFNEFPLDVRIPESMKPELIIANDDLPDLILTRRDELEKFFDNTNAQAANQYQHAISFVIVPNVAPFSKRRPPKKKKPSIMLDDPLLERIRAAQEAAASEDDTGYGRVTFVDEMLDMMEWGYKHGFQVLFSPEERFRQGRVQRELIQELATAYTVDFVVDKQEADALIMCVPDFIVVPPDGKLITGNLLDEKNTPLGVEVPELTVRSCFVAAGRLMANDVPDYLKRKMQKARKPLTAVRADLPGVGIDLTKHPYLGETDLPMDHFTSDGIMADLLNDSMPFAVFTHVAGRSPFFNVPRTMRRRIRPTDGSSTFNQLHLFRQQQYLKRLLQAANLLGLGESLPEDNAEAKAVMMSAIEQITKWIGWYNPKEYVNSFPSQLQKGSEFTIDREEGNRFRAAFGFEHGMIGELVISFD